MTCKICGAAVTPSETETCGTRCRIELEKRRIAWDRQARMVGPQGHYARRHQELVRTNNKHGAKVILAEWKANQARLGPRP